MQVWVFLLRRTSYSVYIYTGAPFLRTRVRGVCENQARERKGGGGGGKFRVRRCIGENKDWRGINACNIGVKQNMSPSFRLEETACLGERAGSWLCILTQIRLKKIRDFAYLFLFYKYNTTQRTCFPGNHRTLF